MNTTATTAIMHRDALRSVHGGNDERRCIAEQALADVRRRRRGQRDRNQCPDAHLVKQHLDREEDTADRRVERGRDAGTSAGRNERRPLPPRHPRETAEPGGERRGDLHDRTLAPDRPPAPDRDGRRDRLHDRDDGPDDRFAVIDRVHHLGHAMPLRLRREVLHQKDDEERAEHGCEHDGRPPRARRRVLARVVVHGELPEEEQVVDDGDQHSKDEGSEPRAHPQDDGEKGERERTEARMRIGNETLRDRSRRESRRRSMLAGHVRRRP
jgi:hypothetical protein